METTSADHAEGAGPGAAVTEPVQRRAAAAPGGSPPVGDASAWDLFRMAFASVAPGTHGLPAAGAGCTRP